MNIYTATEAKRHFGKILNECLFERKAIPVERHGKIIAYVVPVDQWNESKEESKNKPLPALLQLRKIRSRHAGKKSKPDTVDLVKGLREERLQHLLRLSKGK